MSALPEPGEKDRAKGSPASNTAALLILVIVLIALLRLGMPWVKGLREQTAETAILHARDAYSQLTCLENAIKSKTPAGARIAIVSNDPFWRQRLTEISFPWRTVVPERQSASHLVGVMKVPPAGDCLGIRLTVSTT